MPNQKVDANRFAMVPKSAVPRSAFDVRFNHKTTFTGNYLVPVYVDEVLPGDSLNLRMSIFARLATTITPPLDNAYLEGWFFFVPNRLLWSNWKRFMGEQTTPTDTTAFLTPYVTITDAATDAVQGTLGNFFGLIQPAAGQDYRVSALPFRAYNLIYNEWFRDEDLSSALTVSTGDGPDSIVGTYALVKRTKRPDYFTTCRPWTTKPNQSSVSTTLNVLTFQPGGDGVPWSYGPTSAGWTPGYGAPVSGIGVTSQTVTGGATQVYETGARLVDYPRYYSDAGADIRLRATASPAAEYPDVRVMIQDIRTANMLQMFGERQARGGTRYTELVRAHFGVVSPDARLQRPELLGRFRVPVHINPVAQTNASSGTDYLGELAGIGTVAGSGHGFSQSFTEHGWILGIVNTFGDTTYQRGVNRMWFRRTVFDHYFPSWAHLSEQAVLSREIYTTGVAADEDVFGYQERWAEYKWKPSMITGNFQSWAASTLDVWHLAQNFGASRPTLNQAFVEMNTPFSRVLQVSGYATQEFLCDMSFSLRWVRCMPMYSIPALSGTGL